MKNYNIRFKNKTNNDDIGIYYLVNNKIPYNELITDDNILIKKVDDLFINVTKSFNKISFTCSNIGSKVLDRVNNIEYELPQGISNEFSFPLGFKFPDQNYTYSYITSINGLDKYDTSNVTTMEAMFESCKSIESLDLSNFDTSNVTTMQAMFDWCISLKSVNLSSFNTPKLTNMRSMFWGCSSLETIDLSNFDTSNVTTMAWMFGGCSSLTTINLSYLNTPNIKDIGYMFKECTSLKDVNLNFNVENVISMSDLFNGCSSLEILDLSNFITNKLGYLNNAFKNCTLLKELNLSNVNSPSLIWVQEMFNNCILLEKLDLSSFNIKRITKFNDMFKNCNSLMELKCTRDFYNWVNKNKVGLSCPDNMTYLCKYIIVDEDNLEIIGLENYTTTTTPSIKTTTELSFDINNSYVLINKIIPNPDASTSNNFSYETITINSGDASYYDLPNGFYTNLNSSYISNINNINIYDTKNITYMGGMFSGCSELTSLNLSSFDTSNVAYMNNMFFGCSSLESLDLSSFDISNVADMNYMFSGCSNLTYLDLSNFNTSKVSDMSYMFSYCTNLKDINLSNFNSEYITSIYKMFAGCSNLTTLDLSSLDINDYVSCEGMFSECNKLNGIRCTSIFYDWISKNREILQCPDNMINDCQYYLVDTEETKTGLNQIITTTPSVENEDNYKLTFNTSGGMLLVSVYTDESGSKYENKPVTSQDNNTLICKYGYSIGAGMGNMFITEIGNLDKYDTSNITKMSGMFYLLNFESLDLSNFNTTKVTDMSGMFYGCSKLNTLKINKFIINEGTNTTDMFKNCTALSNIWLQQSVYDYLKTIKSTLPSNLVSSCKYYICGPDGEQINTITGLN